MQRSTKYLNQKRRQNRELSKLRSLYRSLATQASFPDSGYYYAQKERSADRLYTKLKKQIKPEKFQRWLMFLQLDIIKDEYNYHCKIQITANGRGYTAADMDRAMAYG